MVDPLHPARAIGDAPGEQGIDQRVPDARVVGQRMPEKDAGVAHLRGVGPQGELLDGAMPAPHQAGEHLPRHVPCRSYRLALLEDLVRRGGPAAGAVVSFGAVQPGAVVGVGRVQCHRGAPVTHQTPAAPGEVRLRQEPPLDRAADVAATVPAPLAAGASAAANAVPPEHGNPFDQTQFEEVAGQRTIE